MTKKTDILNLGTNLKTKEVKPKLFIVSMRGRIGQGSALVNSVSVDFTLEEAIVKAKILAKNATPPSPTGQEVVWNIDSYVDFPVEKIITMFTEFKNATNKNTPS